MGRESRDWKFFWVFYISICEKKLKESDIIKSHSEVAQGPILVQISRINKYFSYLRYIIPGVS